MRQGTRIPAGTRVVVQGDGRREGVKSVKDLAGVGGVRRGLQTVTPPPSLSSTHPRRLKSVCCGLA